VPRFYFDVTVDDEAGADPDGFDFASLEEACEEARTAAAGMANDDKASPKEITILVRGGSGPVATVRLSLTCEC
jgi:hypothetical protein